MPASDVTTGGTCEPFQFHHRNVWHSPVPVAAPSVAVATSPALVSMFA